MQVGGIDGCGQGSVSRAGPIMAQGLSRLQDRMLLLLRSSSVLSWGGWGGSGRSRGCRHSVGDKDRDLSADPSLDQHGQHDEEHQSGQSQSHSSFHRKPNSRAWERGISTAQIGSASSPSASPSSSSSYTFSSCCSSSTCYSSSTTSLSCGCEDAGEFWGCKTAIICGVS